MIPGIQGAVILAGQSAHVPVWTTVFGPLTSSGNSSGWNGYTERSLSNAFTISAPSTQARVTLAPASSAGFTIDAAYMQIKAATGNAYDYATTPVQLKQAGSTTLTALANTDILTDAVAFVLAAGTYTIDVGTHFSATSSTRTFTGGNASYYQPATNQAATIAPTGSWTSTGANLFRKLELLI